MEDGYAAFNVSMCIRIFMRCSQIRHYEMHHRILIVGPSENQVNDWRSPISDIPTTGQACKTHKDICAGSCTEEFVQESRKNVQISRATYWFK